MTNYRGGAVRWPILLLSILAAAACTGEESDAPKDDGTYPDEALESFIGTCAPFPDALEACTPTTCQSVHPFYGSAEEPFTVTREVLGFSDGSACGYRETVPPDSVLTCTFPPDARRQVAAVQRQLIEDYRNGTVTLRSEQVQPDPYSGNCVVERQDGSQIPIPAE